MSHLTRVIVRTLEKIEGRKKLQPVWRIGLALNTEDKRWPQRGKSLTGPQCWSLASLVDASKPYYSFSAAKAGLEKLSLRYVAEMGVDTTTLSERNTRYTRCERFGDIRMRGLAWAAAQAAADPDNESNVAA